MKILATQTPAPQSRFLAHALTAIAGNIKPTLAPRIQKEEFVVVTIVQY
jgi:hypothetical protein